MASTSEILLAMGRTGLGSDAAASAGASASGLAGRVREWASSLAGQINAEVTELGSIHDASLGYSVESWQSQAGDAFRRALHQEQVANRAFGAELGEAAVSTRLAGESIAVSLDALAGALGNLGSLIDNALIGMSRADDVLDDVVVYAERAGLPGLQNELAGHLNNPLLGQVANALAQVGR